MNPSYNALSKEQKHVLLNAGTEAPYTGALLYENADGTYSCAQCNNTLFDSINKFESHCGWPSFDQAIPGSTIEKSDMSHGMVRTEVLCAQCHGHLGHVFPDGPQKTTGMRYCINSLSLNFTDTQGNLKSGQSK